MRDDHPSPPLCHHPAFSGSLLIQFAGHLPESNLLHPIPLALALAPSAGLALVAGLP